MTFQNHIFYFFLLIAFLTHIFLFSLFKLAPLADLISNIKITKVSFVDFEALNPIENFEKANSVELETKSLSSQNHNAKVQGVILNVPSEESTKDIFYQKKSSEQTNSATGNVVIDFSSKRKILLFYKPRYPVWAKRMGLEAEVKFRFKISKDGVVKDIIIEKMSGSPELDVLGLRAIRKWKFEPETKSLSSDEWSQVTLKFSMT